MSISFQSFQSVKACIKSDYVTIDMGTDTRISTTILFYELCDHVTLSTERSIDKMNLN